MKKNRYKTTLKVLKSTEIDSKLEKINEMPTMNTKSVYSRRPGFDVEESPYIFDGFWDGGNQLEEKAPTDFSQNYLKSDPTGMDTSGLIADDGTVLSELPPGGEKFILGPIVDGFIVDGDKSYTNIGYIQKDTRQFVLLARIEGQWKDGMNGSHSVWDGTSNGLKIYNDKFTLEMAQWIQDKVFTGNYVQNVPYFYSGGESQAIKCPACPPNMKGGNGMGPNEVLQQDRVSDFDLEIDELIGNGETSEKIYFTLGRYSHQNKLDINQMQDIIKKIESKQRGKS